MMAQRKPKCYIIAGPNGAGKTTFAENFLPVEAGKLFIKRTPHSLIFSANK